MSLAKPHGGQDKMKKLIALALLALAVSASSVMAGSEPYTMGVKWALYGPTAGVQGALRDTTFLDGAVAKVDTSATAILQNIDLPGTAALAGNNAGVPFLRVNIWTSTGTNVSWDSTFAAVDLKLDSGKWKEGNFVGAVSSTGTGANQLGQSFLLWADPDVGTAVADNALIGVPIRLRIRCDGNTAAKMSAAKLSVTYLRNK